MERWLGKTPLTEMKCAFARQQALTEQPLRALERTSFAEQPGPCDQGSST